MDKIYKIGKIEAISLLICVTTNLIILNIPNVVIFFCGTSSWINVIYVSILAFIFGLIIIKLFKNFQNLDILDISEYFGGKFLKTVIGLCYIAFFIILTVFALRYFSNSLKLIYFNTSPLVFLLILFLIPPVFCNILGVKSVISSCLIFMPVTIISILILLFATIKNFVPERIFPILGYGAYPTFISGSKNIFIFTLFAYVLFLPPLLKKPNQLKSITITSVIMTSIYLLLSIISLLMSFSFIINTDEMLSVYLLTRMVELGTFFQRIDALFIFLWIVATLSLLTLNFFYILYITQKLIKVKRYETLSYSLGLIILGLSLIINDISNIKYWSRNIYNNITVILVFGISLLILIFANIKYKKTHKENSQ